MTNHRLKQRLHAPDIIVEVLQRSGNAFADERIRRKMDHRIDLVLLKNLVEHRGISNVALVKLDAGIERLAMPRLKVVDNNDVLAVGNEPTHRMRTDIARAPAYQH